MLFGDSGNEYVKHMTGIYLNKRETVFTQRSDKGGQTPHNLVN